MQVLHRGLIIQLEAISDAVTSAVTGLPFVLKVTREGDCLTAELSDAEKNRPELVKRIVEAGGRIMGVSEESHSLEDIYLSLVQENKP